MTVRLGAVTKRGHADAIFDGFGPIWGWFSLCDLLVADGLTLVTDFIGMTAALAIFGKSKFKRSQRPSLTSQSALCRQGCDLDQHTPAENSLLNYVASST
jgi:hypothetical protein